MPWRLQQTGDTLVEVVMSLAILAVTLVTAFNIANQSYSEGFQAREHTQAIYLAQEQAEKLYLYRNNLIAQNPSAGTPILNAINFGACSSTCHFDPLSATPTSGQYTPALFNGITYYVAIGPPASGGSIYVNPDELSFTVTVTWNAAVSTGVVAASGTNENTTSLNLILVDNRGIVPRDCSVAGSAQCS
jgi:Tfp pilus assembly protein PilV